MRGHDADGDAIAGGAGGGDHPRLVIADDAKAGRGLFRGIRDALSRAEPSDHLMIAGGAPAGLFEDPAFRAGVARLGARGLTYDSWHYHYQSPEFLALARAVPDTTMVLDHFGTPIGVSAIVNRNLDQIVEAIRQNVDLKNAPKDIPPPQMLIAIVGKRNAGKSTLVNAIARLFVGATPASPAARTGEAGVALLPAAIWGLARFACRTGTRRAALGAAAPTKVPVSNLVVRNC